jgi:hypothetical protein
MIGDFLPWTTFFFVASNLFFTALSLHLLKFPFVAPLGVSGGVSAMNEAEESRKDIFRSILVSRRFAFRSQLLKQQLN